MALSPGELPQFGPSFRRGCQALITTVSTSNYLLHCIDTISILVSPQLTALSESGSNSTLAVIPLAGVPVTSPAQPEVNITCRRTLNKSTGLITAHLEWSYEYNPLIQDAISMYTFTYRLVPGGPLGSISNFNPSITSQVSAKLTAIIQSDVLYISVLSELMHLQTIAVAILP